MLQEGIHELIRCPLKELLPGARDQLDATYRCGKRISHHRLGASLSKFMYHDAVTQKALRLSLRIPDGMRRQIPIRGAPVAGHFLPEGTVASIPQWITYQSPTSFYKPQVFLPDHWLGGESYASSQCTSDRKDAFNPFCSVPTIVLEEP